TSRDQGISKAGNTKARTTMIELTWLWLWLRNQPGSLLSVWFRERVASRKGRIKRIAFVGALHGPSDKANDKVSVVNWNSGIRMAPSSKYCSAQRYAPAPCGRRLQSCEF